MERIYATYDENDSVYVASYGIEADSEKAHWGRGKRNQTIIHYVLKGEGYYNGKKVKEGEGFFIPNESVHEYYSSKENPWQYFWVILEGKDADKLCHKYINMDKNKIFTYDFKEELTYFAKKFFGVKRELSSAKAMGIFYLLMSYHENKEVISNNDYVAKAQQYMEQNYFRRVSICEIAKVLHISDRYLYNLFIQYTGISPKKYLNELRLRRACKMLKSADCNITEIAVSTGFDDVLTFSRFFSKHMKVSPTKYRQKQ